MKIKNLFFLSFIFLTFLLLSSNVHAESYNVLLVTIDGTIDQSTVELLKESMERAEVENSQAIILLIDTPGGGLSETFDIADMIKTSEIPVIGYVYPSGSTAWSAGTFILMSTHLSAMADHTIIGSCQPVEIGISGTRTINDSKIINALVGWMQERADMYGRNQTIAERFITENLNLNASQAVKYNVVEFVSSSIDQLLDDIDGTNVSTATGYVILHTKDATKTTYSPSLKVQFIKIISDPMLTSLLFLLGIFSLIFGLSSPGYGAEVFGVIAIMLSLIGSGFEISVISTIFIIIGFLLLIIEIFVTPGFGVIGIGGIISLVIGAIFLVPSFTNREWAISMDWINDLILVILVAGILIAIFFAFLLYKVLQIRKKKTAVGTFVGEEAKTIDRISSEGTGYVRFKGEYWQAKSDEVIEPNTKVVIVDKDDEILIVKPMENSSKH